MRKCIAPSPKQRYRGGHLFPFRGQPQKRDQPFLSFSFPGYMTQIISISHFPQRMRINRRLTLVHLLFLCIEYTLKGEKLTGNMLGKDSEAPHKPEVSGSKAP